MNSNVGEGSPETVVRHAPPRAHRDALLCGIIAAAVLVGLTTYRLDKPGIFYDEVHQATGAFAYIGRPAPLFSLIPVGGLPLLNMPYSGAIKTAIYGVYLRASGRAFSIVSWRLLGVIFTASGIVAFALIGGHRLPLAALILFFVLLLCDTNLLLQTRHDWGPAALGFFLRMVLLGLWLRYHAPSNRGRGSFVLGVIVGIAIYEKLTSIVLLGPLAMMLLANPQTRSLRHAAYAAIGIGIGALPMIGANLYWLATHHTLMVASSIDTLPGRSIVGYAANYLALGNGGIERRMIFDTHPFRWTEWLEGSAIIGLMLAVAAVAWKRGSTDLPARLAGVALAGYVAIAIAMRWLPHRTAEQHWIVGTPFQYLGIALASASIWGKSAPSNGLRWLFATCLALLLIARVPAGMSAFAAVRDDKYSMIWDPSLNTAAAFAARQPENTVFIAANWGTAAQVFCFANGRQNFVVEPFTQYQGHLTMDRLLAGRQLAVVAAVKPLVPLKPGEVNTLWQVTDEIFDNIATAPNWEEAPVDRSVQNLRAVEIRVFRRVPSPH